MRRLLSIQLLYLNIENGNGCPPSSGEQCMNKMRILTMREKAKYQTEVTDLKDTITAQNFNRGI